MDVCMCVCVGLCVCECSSIQWPEGSWSSHVVVCEQLTVGAGDKHGLSVRAVCVLN